MTCRLCQGPALRGDTLCCDCGELAAILQYEADYSREDAEAEALKRILKRKAFTKKEIAGVRRG